MNLSLGIKGEYEISVFRDGVEREHYEFQNMLLDVFLDRWSNPTGTQTTSGAYCFVGAGTTPPVESNTQLEAFVAQAPGAVSMQYSVGAANEKIGSDYWAKGTFTFNFNLGQVVGNISEVGIQMSSGVSAHTNIDSRALIKDSVGNPITITLTAADQLVVRYKLRLKLPTTQTSGTFTIDSVSTTVTYECLNALSINAWSLYNMIPPYSSRPNAGVFSTSALRNNPELGRPTSNGSTGIVTSTVTKIAPGIKKYTFTIPVSGIPSVGSTFTYLSMEPASAISTSGDISQFGLHFNPAVTKTNEQTMTIGYEVTLTRL